MRATVDLEAARRLLGVVAADGEDVLRSAYRKKALETHPDRGGSADAFAAVAEAYRVAKGYVGVDLGRAYDPGAGARQAPRPGPYTGGLNDFMRDYAHDWSDSRPGSAPDWSIWDEMMQGRGYGPGVGGFDSRDRASGAREQRRQDAEWMRRYEAEAKKQAAAAAEQARVDRAARAERDREAEAQRKRREQKAAVRKAVAEAEADRQAARVVYAQAARAAWLASGGSSEGWVKFISGSPA